jgi:hypothetical protein
MQVRDFYKKYNLMPQLIAHQLRVGAIVKLIGGDRDAILTALVHDMGNMAKFSKLDKHWSKEQEKFRAKYGKDAHIATSMILRESGLDKLYDYIQIEANLFEEIMKQSDLKRICRPAVLTLYADCRVAYDGVVSLDDRIVDLENRYNEKRTERIWGPKLEEYVQSLTEIDVAAITEAMVEPLFDELLDYQI